MTLKNFPKKLTAICALILPLTSLAQDTELEEMIIESTRLSRTMESTPLSISVVTQEDLQLGRQQLALDEALASVPGLFMQNRYNFAQDLRVSIRGFGARSAFGIRGIKILVDGIPLTVADGQGQVDTIDLGATKQVEIIRGPSSALYGNAAGGVISVTSEEGPETPFVSMRATGGEYGYQKLAVKTGGQTENINYFLSLSDSQIDGYREHSEAENTQLTGRLNFDLGMERELLLILNHTDQPLSNDPGGITLQQASSDRDSAYARNVAYDSGETVTQTRLGAVYSTPLGNNGELTARGYVDERDFQAKLPQFPVADAVDLDRKFSGFGLTYAHEGFIGQIPSRVLIGFDLDDQDDDRKRLINNQGTLGALIFDQNEQVTSQGIFAQNELALSDNLQLTLGVRYDQVDFSVSDYFLADGDDSGNRELDDVSPMLGLAYQLDANTSFYSSISTSFETPTTTEFANPSGGGGFNPNVEPQKATNYEVGARGRIHESTSYQVAVFKTNVEDELISYDDNGRDFFQNAGSSSRTGIEFSATSKLTERLESTVSLSYGDFAFDTFRELSFDAMGNATVVNDFSGQRIPGTVEQLGFIELKYTDPNGWYSALDLTYTGDQFANNDNTVNVDSYTLANWRLGADYRIGSSVLSPFIGINNLSDQEYYSNIRINAFGGRYFEPAPGRNVYAGVELRLDL
ncbi:MAG: TonB-dependent receptor [Gammaproteobacteria bacterium]